MNRRSLLKTAAVQPLAVRPGVGADSTVSGRKPNILILISDQHRPDLLSCRGSDLVATPHIDRIADQGVRFERAYCPAPVCVPSRMSLLTGMYPHHHGAVDNSLALPWRTPTIAHHFRDHGYLTALIGKMHFHDAHNHGFDYKIGFNDWFSYLGPRTRHVANENHSNWICGPTLNCEGCGFPELPGLFEQNPWLGHVTKMQKLASELPPEDHFDAFVAREAAKFMRRYKDEPWLLVAGFLKPHAPFHPPAPWADPLYDPGKMSLRPVGDISSYPTYIQKLIATHQSRGQATLRFRRAGYLGNLAFMDWCVGQIDRALSDLGLLDNTIVVYTSDHGEMDGEHGLNEKDVFFEPAAGVPLILRYPGRLPQGRVSRALVEYSGLFPTLAELAGTTAPSGLDVASFAALAREPERPGAAAAYAELSLRTRPRLMVRTDRHKYVWNSGDRAELYDLEEDPGERVNLAGRTATRQLESRLHDQLIAWFDSKRNPYRTKVGRGDVPRK